MKMINLIKRLIKPYVPFFLLSQLRKQRNKMQIEEWEKNGCPVPPPSIVKQNIVGEYQEKFGHTVLIETGTYMGFMVEAQKKRFRKVISIELAVDLFEMAKQKFKNDKNVTIVYGDSGKVLPVLLKDLNEPAIFWLDGHYSEGVTVKGDKECPIFDELEAIFNSKKFNHILLIDDARCFTGVGDYPTINTLSDFIKSNNENYKVEVKYDIIRCVI